MPKIKTCLYVASFFVSVASMLSAAGEDQRRMEGRRSDSQEMRTERREQFRQEIENRHKKDSAPQREFNRRPGDRPWQQNERAGEEYLKNRKKRREMPVVKPENKTPENRTKERLERKDFREHRTVWRDRGRVIRDRFYVDRSRRHIFDDEFWVGFRRRHRHWHFSNNFVWGAVVTWPAVSLWFPWGWSAPRYYYYSDNGAIYYGEGQDFTYLTPVDSADFVREARRIANVQLPLSTDQSQWMPLGMFAIAKQGADPTEFLSLAINKQGFVSGAYENTETGESAVVSGSVDQKSQRVAWRFVDKEWPIMESGIYNLTRAESSLLVHFSDQRTESRLIVRLDDK